MKWYTHLGHGLQVLGISLAAIAPTELLWMRSGMIIVALGKCIEIIFPEPKLPN